MRNWATRVLVALVVYSVAGNLVMMQSGISSVPVWYLWTILMAEIAAILLAVVLFTIAASDRRIAPAIGYFALSVPPVFFIASLDSIEAQNFAFATEAMNSVSWFTDAGLAANGRLIQVKVGRGRAG